MLKLKKKVSKKAKRCNKAHGVCKTFVDYLCVACVLFFAVPLKIQYYDDDDWIVVIIPKGKRHKKHKLFFVVSNVFECAILLTLPAHIWLCNVFQSNLFGFDFFIRIQCISVSCNLHTIWDLYCAVKIDFCCYFLFYYIKSFPMTRKWLHQ